MSGKLIAGAVAQHSEQRGRCGAILRVPAWPSLQMSLRVGPRHCSISFAFVAYSSRQSVATKGANLTDRSSFDSPLEEDGFELPVPRHSKLADRDRGMRPRKSVRIRLTAGGRSIRTIGPRHERAGFCCGRRIAASNGGSQKGLFLMRDRWFESGPLHRRVTNFRSLSSW
jgi:hypothetical protein